MKNFVEELKWRGMLAQIMPGTEEYLQSHLSQPISAQILPPIHFISAICAAS